MEFRRVEIPDYGVPPVAELREVADALLGQIRAARTVVIHCRAGIGRSSVVAAGVLVRSGVAPGDAWRVIETARGLSVPDTDEQRAVVAGFA